MPVGTQPEISHQSGVLLVPSFERARGVDLAAGNVWFSFCSRGRSENNRSFEQLHIVFWLLLMFSSQVFFVSASGSSSRIAPYFNLKGFNR